MKHLLIGLALLCPFAAAAQPSSPASISECERIKNDFAYNQCLASFGPKRGDQPVREAADGDDEGSPAGTSGRRPVMRRGGREAATFDVISGSNGVGRPGRGSRQAR